MSNPIQANVNGHLVHPAGTLSDSDKNDGIKEF